MRDRIKEANGWADSQILPAYVTNDKSEYPKPKEGGETYGSYKKRVDALIEKNGFDLGRLSFSQYTDYCRGNYAPSSTEFDDHVAYHETPDTE